VGCSVFCSIPVCGDIACWHRDAELHLRLQIAHMCVAVFVAVCCNVLQCTSVWKQRVGVETLSFTFVFNWHTFSKVSSLLNSPCKSTIKQTDCHIVVCCSVLQCVTECCSVLPLRKKS